jgi:hypothetical protein
MTPLLFWLARAHEEGHPSFASHPHCPAGFSDLSFVPQCPKCLDFVKNYRRGARTPLAKASTIHKISTALSSGATKFTDAEINEALGSYLKIIEQCDQSAEAAARTCGDDDSRGSRSETIEDPPAGSKCPGSQYTLEGPGKRQRGEEAEYSWTISGLGLCDELQKTLDLLKLYGKDLKLAKSSILTAANAPRFPTSEWSNILVGAMVDLDHVISGSFAVSSDNRDVEVIAWGSYTQAVMFAFLHRKSELDAYGARTLSMFVATAPEHHSRILSLNKAVRVRVGERRNLLLYSQA